MSALEQIKVHGSSDDNSGSVKSNVHDLSEEGDLISGNNRNRSNSSIEHDVLSEEHIEDAKKLEESSGQERSVICLTISVILYIWYMRSCDYDNSSCRTAVFI
jgi:hypothetical protein